MRIAIIGLNGIFVDILFLTAHMLASLHGYSMVMKGFLFMQMSISISVYFTYSFNINEFSWSIVANNKKILFLINYR